MVRTVRQPPLRGMRILAVDDHPDLLEMLTVLLEQQGAEVIGCQSAGEAFQVLASGNALDAAVFDISMPDEDGLTLLGRLRDLETDRAGRLPVVALTAHVTSDMERRCRDAGFDHYLSKPVAPAELFDVLKRLATLH